MLGPNAFIFRGLIGFGELPVLRLSHKGLGGFQLHMASRNSQREALNYAKALALHGRLGLATQALGVLV